MSLPLPVSSSSPTPRGPSAPPRTGVKAPLPGAASRSHATTRASAHGPAKGPRAKEGFASVLAAAQQDDQASTAPARTSAGGAATTPRPVAVETEPDRKGSTGEPVDPAPASADEGRTAVAAQTPWLLFALGSRSHTWQEGGASLPDGEGAGEDPAGSVDPGVAGSTADVNGLATTGQVPQVPLAVEASGGAEALAAASALASSGPVPDATGLTAGAPDDGGSGAALSAAPELSGRVTTGADESVAAADDGATAGPAQQPDATRVARVTLPGTELSQQGAAAGVPDQAMAENGMANGKGPETPVLSGASAPVVSDGRTQRPAASPSSASVDGLAAAEGGDVAADGAALGAALGAAAEAGAESTVSPSRTHEALLRLAQAADGVPSHGHSATNVPTAVPVDVQVAASHAPTTSVAATAPLLPPAVAEQVLDKVVGSLRMQWKDGIGEAKVQLHPEGYGQVNVALKVEAGAVTAVVRADSADVQEWVVRNQETLRQQLEAAGLRLDELVVTPDGQRQRERQQAQEQPRRRQPATATEAGLRFEQLL